MAKTFTPPPQWSNVGSAPSETLKTNGFQAGYKPSAPVFNYLFNKYGTCIGELQNAVNEASEAEHTHPISDVVGLQDALNGKANTSHTHAQGDITGLDTALSGKASASHTHSLDDISETTAKKIMTADERTKLSGIATGANNYTHPTSHPASMITGLADVATSGSYNDLSDKPTSMTPTAHTHAQSDVTGLATALSGKADTGHTHTTSDITGLSEALSSSQVGKSLAGQTVHPAYENLIITTATAGDGAEIFNDYRERTYLSDGGISQGNVASGKYSHAEGIYTTASGDYSHAEGYCTKASGENSHAEGFYTTPKGGCSHAEGSRTTASGENSHAEGGSTTASGESSHAEGNLTTAKGLYSHAEGYYARANGTASHAEGFLTTASGYCSHAGGYDTHANDYQFVTGKYNIQKTGCTDKDDQSTDNSIFIVGYGTSSTSANAFRITAAGKCYGSTSFGSSGADYAEYFEWQDGNENNEDRRGLFVTLDGDKIRLANGNDDYIVGVISANPSVIGDVQSENWHGMYKKDVFGQPLTETVEVPESTDEKTGEVIPAHTATFFVVNPDYNPDEEYTSREFRKEWACVGLMGKLIVVDDGTCEVNGYCKVTDGGKATKADTGYRVMKRLDDTHIQILYR